VLRDYRRRFQPSAAFPEPSAILATSVLCAETDERADALAATLDLAWLRIAQGQRGEAPTLEQAQAYSYSPAEERLRQANRARHVIGSPATVQAALRTVTDAAEVDEVMVLTLAHDHATRVRAHELLAEAVARDAA
jgi:alkanesulfonate monooxygenase SsuD/methylene tetrahydromethanopterin reductase-like flavin-dependent oxidoreductase (luciferase family)